MKTETLPTTVSSATMADDTFSKQDYLTGLRCCKALYLKKYKKELATAITGQQIKEGLHFEREARDIIAPGGIEIIINTANLDSAAQKTRQLLSQKGPVIVYQAVFKNSAGELAIADLVVKDSKGIRLFEFKAATQIEDTHVYDATYQLHCASTSGYQISKVNLVYVNKHYVRHGMLSKEFLCIKDVTEVTNRMKRSVPVSIATLKKTLALEEEPDKEIGLYCLNPRPCPFKDYCWAHLPTNNIFDVKSMKIANKFGLYYKGIETMADLKDQVGSKLKENQIIQINSALTNSTAIQPTILKEWCGKLSGKELLFWDVETIMPVVPLFNGTKPYEQIVTQYSLHIRGLDGELTHKEFLAPAIPEYDFRRVLLAQLLLDLKANDSTAPIIVFNKSFEAGRLRELAKRFPEYSDEIKNVLGRIVDLMEVFKSKWYYDPRFGGSFSIKAVLPVLCPDLDYKKLEISNGSQAVEEFMKMYELSERKQNRIRKSLLAYCKMDTYAMVRILEFLEKI